MKNVHYEIKQIKYKNIYNDVYPMKWCGSSYVSIYTTMNMKLREVYFRCTLKPYVYIFVFVNIRQGKLICIAHFRHRGNSRGDHRGRITRQEAPQNCESEDKTLVKNQAVVLYLLCVGLGVLNAPLDLTLLHWRYSLILGFVCCNNNFFLTGL